LELIKTMTKNGMDVTLSSVRLSLLVLFVQLAPALSSGETHAFEWAGIFTTPEDTYLWTAQKVKPATGVPAYADATMKMVVLAAPSASDAELHSLESAGEAALELPTCTSVVSGGTISPAPNTCYQLTFKQDWWQSLYTINAAGAAALAFFTEHVPTEFENTAHYLKDDHGDDIEPVAELPEEAAVAPTPAPEEEKYWGEGILVSLIVNVVTLAGVVFVLPGIKTLKEKYDEEFNCVVSAFAAGAISACAFFLLLFESTHLIAVEYTEEEVDVSWRWGTMILAGALFPTVVHAIVEVATKQSPAAGKGTDAEKGTELAVPVGVSRPRLIASVLIGDFMHNMCDGFFIGAAFKGCGKSTGWTVAWSTVGHEFAQELGDYLVLTGKECALHPAIALALNFLSGTGIMLGCLVVLSTEVKDVDTGLILAFGGGVYLNIAFIECMAKFQNSKVSGLVRLFGIFLFMVGATLIGLILVWHEHCVPPLPAGAVAPAGGHHHR
jgi:zinc transporter ZupT